MYLCPRGIRENVCGRPASCHFSGIRQANHPVIKRQLSIDFCFCCRYIEDWIGADSSLSKACTAKRNHSFLFLSLKGMPYCARKPPVHQATLISLRLPPPFLNLRTLNLLRLLINSLSIKGYMKTLMKYLHIEDQTVNSPMCVICIRFGTNYQIT